MSESPNEHPVWRQLRACPAYYRIAFDPVPVKARHDGWTAERQRRFIDLLVITGCVSRSARALGMSPQGAHMLRRHPRAASFNQAWDEALANGRSFQLQLGILRCLEGERRPVMYRGRKVGEQVRYDNSLAIAVLKATAGPEPPADDPAAELDRELRRMRGPGRRTKGGRRRR
ncbi:MAG TPA: hypothetical protein VF693_06950 [Allosphingosinicella sp.]|jgi:hypothetical protein